jgi:hypothetical protein
VHYNGQFPERVQKTVWHQTKNKLTAAYQHHKKAIYYHVQLCIQECDAEILLKETDTLTNKWRQESAALNVPAKRRQKTTIPFRLRSPLIAGVQSPKQASGFIANAMDHSDRTCRPMRGRKPFAHNANSLLSSVVLGLMFLRSLLYFLAGCAVSVPMVLAVSALSRSCRFQHWVLLSFCMNGPLPTSRHHHQICGRTNPTEPACRQLQRILFEPW